MHGEWKEDGTLDLSNGYTVYKVFFSSGVGGAGEMNPILKVENTSVTLPANAFTNTGSVFQNWEGNEKDGKKPVYRDQSVYSANSNETLTAIWSNDGYPVEVHYHYMGTDGQYGNSYEKENFHVPYNTVWNVQQDDEPIHKPKAGFEVDTEKNLESVTITEKDQVVDIWYARKQYKISYTYNNPGEAAPASIEDEEYYYGAPITVHEIPTCEGYYFVGWKFNDSGEQPETMPAADLHVTGTFVEEDITYHVCYYLQNLDNDRTIPIDTYELGTDATIARDVKSHTGAKIAYNDDTAPEVEGYTFVGAAASFGDSAGGTKPSGLSTRLEESVREEGKKELYISLYYDRNPYTVTLNVWKGDIPKDAGKAPLYTHTWSGDEQVYYGADFKFADYESFDKDKWDKEDGDGYQLTDEFSYSTGEVVSSQNNEGRPEKVPAGDIIITRQYVLANDGRYEVEVMTENPDGTYASHVYTYRDSVGKKVRVGTGTNADDEGDTAITVPFSQFDATVSHFSDYVYVPYENIPEEVKTKQNLQPEKLTGLVTDTENKRETVEKLRIYLEREKKTSVIKYWLIDPDGNGGATKTQLAEVEQKVKWGDYYSVEPLSYFDGNSAGAFQYEPTSKKLSIDLSKFQNYKTSNYVVSFDGYYYYPDDEKTGDGRIWYTYDFNTISSLTSTVQKNGLTLGNDSSIRMGFTEEHQEEAVNYVNIYYTKVDEKQFRRLRVVYRPSSLVDAKDEKDVPLTADYDGEHFDHVYIASEASFYNNVTYQADGDWSAYPGLALYNHAGSETDADNGGSFDYSTDAANLKDGYQWSGDGKYILNKTEKALYLVDKSNNLYFGHRYGYVYKESDPGYSQVKDFLNQYKEKNASDPKAAGAHVYKTNWGSQVVKENEDLIITFEDGKIVRLNYFEGGKAVRYQDYAAGQGPTAADIEKIEDRPGYEVVWYVDDAFTTELAGYINSQPNGTWNLSEDTVVYGRYEKKKYNNFEYAYYELSSHGEESAYLTEATLDQAAVIAEPADYNDQTETVNWYLRNTDGTRGDLVITRKLHKEESFVKVSMNAEAYRKTGFEFDAANNGNILVGYPQGEAVTLHAYFKRKSERFTMDAKLHEKNNPVTAEYRYGTVVSISDPTDDGYDFTGWKWSHSEDGKTYTYYDQAPVSVTGGAFLMPDVSYLKAEASWEAAENDQVIMHYFQNPDLTYDTDAVETMKASVQSVTVRYNGTDYSNGKYYANGGVSFLIGENEYYSVAPEKTDSVYVVTKDNLSAIRETRKIKQDTADNKVSDYQKGVQGDYTFAYALRQYNREPVQTLKTGDGFTEKFGMTLAYYYKLNTYTVTTAVEVTNPFEGVTDNAATLLGAGSFFYGDKITLSAIVAEGYDFNGWYLNGRMISGERTVSNLKVTADANYIAKLTAKEADQAGITITGVSSLTYGTQAAGGNVLNALVKRQNEEDTATSITAYRWYLVDEQGQKIKQIEGADSASYRIPEDWNAGTYYFVCEADLARNDNGRTRTRESDKYKVTIGQAFPTVVVNSITKEYDAKPSDPMTVRVSGPAEGEYEIYYSEEEMTSYEEAIKKGDKNPISKTNVRVIEDGSGKHRGAYTIHYYVHILSDKNGNYKDVYSVNNPSDTETELEAGTIDITPVKVLLINGGATYSKEYDGTDLVKGTTTDESTDLYKLVHNEKLYTISGIVKGEPVKLVAKGTATFDTRHVSARTVTLTKLELVNDEEQKDENGNVIFANGAVNYNYIFDSSFSITLSGRIVPKELDLSWSNAELTYNGKAQSPAWSFVDGDKEVDLESLLPDADKGNLQLKVAGSMVNANDGKNDTKYQAVAEFAKTDKQNNDSETRDFLIKNSSKEYVIHKREISVKPKDNVLVYNGEGQKIWGLLEYTNNQETDTLELDLEKGMTAADGQIVKAEPDSMPKDVKYADGKVTSYDVKATNVKVFDGADDISFNYVINTEATGKLTIQPREIYADGFTAGSRVYDGTTEAKSILDKKATIVFRDVKTRKEIHLGQDVLSLDFDRITASFDNAEAGQNKKITLSGLSNALLVNGGSNTGNYILRDNAETAGTITQKTIKVKAVDTTVTYGEKFAFSVSYEGIPEEVKNDKELIASWNEKFKEYRIAQDGKQTEYISENSSEDGKDIRITPVGTYSLIPVLPDMGEGGNYTFELDKSYGSLIVEQRPVRLAVNALEKIYDGNTDAFLTSKNEKGESQKQYQFTELTSDKETESKAASGLKDGDTLDLTEEVKASYDNKNADEGKAVTLKEVALSNANYKIAETYIAKGKITKRPITLQAKNVGITYGDAKPAFEIDYSKAEFVKGDDSGSISGTPTYTCEYDPGQADKRNAGSYNILPDGLTSQNYDITFSNAGKLTVKKAVLTITTVPKKDANGNDITSATYGKNPVPEFDFKCDGWKYNEDNFNNAVTVKTEDGKVRFTHLDAGTSEGKSVITSIPGTYDIYVLEDNLESQNYSFKCVPMTLTVARYQLTIKDIQPRNKVYDSTTDLKEPNLYLQGNKNHENDYATYDGLLDIDKKHFEKEENLNEPVVIITNGYSKADKGTYTETFNVQLGGYLQQRCYVIDNDKTAKDQTTVAITVQNNVISPRPFVVRAAGQTVKYGEQLEAYSLLNDTKEKDTEGKDKPDTGWVNGENFGTENFTWETNYKASSETGEYTEAGTKGIFIRADVFHKLDDESAAGPHWANYTQSAKEDGKVTVIRNQLTAPKIQWSTAEPGVVTWNAVDGIGNVAVDHYTVTLTDKDGNAVTLTDKDGNVLTTSVEVKAGDGEGLKYSYADVMHQANKANVYAASVIAVPVTDTTNTDYRNVIASEKGITDTKTYTAMVSWEIRQDKPKRPLTEVVTAKTVNSSVSYCMIAGESGISVNAALDTATGYTAEVSVPEGSGLTLSNATDTIRTDKNYHANIGLNFANKDTESYPNELKLVMELTSVKSTASVSISPAGNTLTYGYTDADPNGKFTAEVAFGPDEVKSDQGYSYTYTWTSKKILNTIESPSHEKNSTKDTNANKDTYQFPTGQNANDKQKSDPGKYVYSVNCKVNVTRKDNGETIELNKVTGNVVVKPASFTATVTQAGWTYGNARTDYSWQLDEPYKTSMPLADQNRIKAKPAEYAVKPESGAEAVWSTKKPTDAGEYQVRVTLYDSGVEQGQEKNFEDFTAEPAGFTIKQAQFETPSNVNLEASDTSASYGQITWNKVPGIRENGENKESVTTVTPLYEVVLYKQDNSGTVEHNNKKFTEIRRVSDIADNGTTASLNILEQLKQGGTFFYTIQAYAKEGSDKKNCKDSALYESSDIFIGGSISVSENAAIEVDTYKHVYDSSEVILTAQFDLHNKPISYQWYHNGHELSGETNSTLSRIFVADSGNYDCAITVDGITYHTPGINLSITPREITVHSKSTSKTYDGTPLTADEWWITDGEGEGAESAHAQSVSGKTDSTPPTFVEDTKAGNDVITGVVVSGSRIDAGSNENTVSIDAMTITRNSVLVYSASMAATNTANYSIKKVEPGTLTIEKRAYTKLGLTVESVKKVWDNQPVYISGSINLTNDTDLTEEVRKTVNADTKLQYRWKLHDTGTWHKENGKIWFDYNANKKPYFTMVQHYESNGVTKYTYVDVEVRAINSNYEDPTDEPTGKNVVTGTIDIQKRPVKVEIIGTQNADGTVKRGTVVDEKMQIHKTFGEKDPAPDKYAVKIEKSTPGSKRGAVSDQDYNNMVADFGVSRAKDSDGEDVGIYGLRSLQVKALDTDHYFNYDIDFGTAQLVIDPAPADSRIVVTQPSDVDYQSAAWEPEMTVTDSALAEGSRTLAKGTDYTVTYADNINAGTATVTVTGEGNYSGTVTRTFKINQIPLEITGESFERIYNGLALTSDEITGNKYSITAGSLAGKDQIDSVTYGVRKTGSQTEEENRTNVGFSDNLPLTISIKNGDVDVTGNYRITMRPGTLTVTPLPVELTWSDSNLIYNGQEQSVTAEVSNAVEINGKKDEIRLTYQDPTEDQKNTTHTAIKVGDYQAVVTGLDNPNYTLEGGTGLSQSWKISWSTDDALAYLDGTKGDDDWYVSDVTIHAPEGYQIAEAPDAAFTDGAVLTITKEDANNTFHYYLKNKETGSITAEKTAALPDAAAKKDLAVTFVKIDKTAPTGEIKVRGNLFREILNTVTFGYFFKSTEEAAIENAADAVSGIASEQFYVSTAAKTEQDLAKLQGSDWKDSASLEPNEKVFVYAKITDHAGHVTYLGTDGLVSYTDTAADTAFAAHTRTETDDQKAHVNLNGNTIRKITVRSKADGAKAVDITADSDKVDFDADGNITLKSSYLNTLEAGDYTVTVSSNPLGVTYRPNMQPNADGTEADQNDAPAEVTFTLTVSRHADTVAINKEGKTYDGTPLTVTADDISRNSKADPDQIQILYKEKDQPDDAYKATAPTDAGSYTVKVTVPGDEDYTETTVTKDLTIAKADQTITAENLTAVYDGQPHQIAGATSKGVNVSEQASEPGQISYSADNSLTDVGEVTVTIHAAETKNYNPSSLTAALKITARPVIITAGSKGKVYDGEKLEEKSFSTSGRKGNPDSGLVTGHTVSRLTYTVCKTGAKEAEVRSSAGRSDNVPSDAVLADAAGKDVTKNYEITYQTGSLEITKAEQKIFAEDQSFIYDGQPHQITGAAAEGVNVSDRASKPGEIRYSDNNSLTNAADGPIVVTVKAAETENYKAAEKQVTLSISKAALAAPEKISWNSDRLGTCSFDAVPGIGAVEVKSYRAKLLDADGKTIAEHDIDAKQDAGSNPDETGRIETDFAEEIRNTGPGKYRVQVQAIASEENNREKVNVTDSEYSEAGSWIYAVRVFAKGADDEATTEGLDKAYLIREGEEPAESLTVIAGETLKFRALLRETDGALYSVEKVEEGRKDTDQKEETENQEGKLVIEKTGLTEGTIKVSEKLTDSEDIPVIVTLNKETGVIDKRCDVGEGAPESTFNNTLQELIDMGTLTEDEIEAAEEGENVHIILRVSYLPVKNLPSGEQEKIEDAANAAFGADKDPSIKITISYFDVSLFIRMTRLLTENGKTEVTENERKLSESRGDISVTITVPEELRKEGRTFILFHVKHDGTVENLGSFQTDTYTFTTREFSTYALAYYDKAAAAEPDKGNGEEPKPSNQPKDNGKPNTDAGQNSDGKTAGAEGKHDSTKPGNKPVDSKAVQIVENRKRNGLAEPEAKKYFAGEAQTGDSNEMMVWFWIFAVAVFAAVWLVQIRRKSKK